MNAKFYNLFDLLNDHELKNESVLEQLVNHCKKIGLRVNLLEKWSDIDTFSDLKKCATRSGFLSIKNTLEVCADEGINL